MNDDIGTIIMDIDGSLCPLKKVNQSYDDIEPDLQIVKKLTLFHKKGWKIILYTSRGMRTYNGNVDLILSNVKPKLIEWLNLNNIPYDDIKFGKLWPGMRGFYVDDRSIRPREFGTLDLAEIEMLIDNDRSK